MSSLTEKEKYFNNYETDDDFVGAAAELDELHTFVAYVDESEKTYYKKDWDENLPDKYMPANIPGAVQVFNTVAQTKTVMKVSDYVAKYKDDVTMVPVGLVVIPKTHDVYGTGEGALISLQEMSYSTPDTGTNSSRQYMYWGYNSKDISGMTNYTYAPCLGHDVFGSSDNEVDHMQYIYNAAGYLPSDRTDGSWTIAINNDYDPGTSWKVSTGSSYHHVASPYLADGSRNYNYYGTEFFDADGNVLANSALNCLSDFDGKGNTEKILAEVTVADWQTLTSIANRYSAGNYPAACCCWRYSTQGTNKGDWYLPSAGELGYMIVRLQALNTALTALGALAIGTSNSYWSSTEYSSYNAVHLYTDSGRINHYNKGNNICVRAFCRF